MSQEEKIGLLEELMDLEPGTIDADSVLADIEEWDSLTKLSLMAEAKKRFNRILTTDDMKAFVTVGDILEILV